MTTREKLLALADYMETKVKPETFRMTEWSCGKTCCAAGHACTLFADRGLYLFDGSFPAFGTARDWCAIEKFFSGLRWAEMTHLFCGMNRQGWTPKQWAEHCRRFVAERNLE